MLKRSAISYDAMYLQLDNELRDLKQQRQKTRPANYLLLAIVLGVLGFFLPTLFGIIAWLFAVASLLTMMTTMLKVGKLNGQITEVETQMESLASDTPRPSTPAPTTSSIAYRIVELQELLDKKLVTQEEFDTKKAELIEQI